MEERIIPITFIVLFILSLVLIKILLINEKYKTSDKNSVSINKDRILAVVDAIEHMTFHDATNSMVPLRNQYQYHIQKNHLMIIHDLYTSLIRNFRILTELSVIDNPFGDIINHPPNNFIMFYNNDIISILYRNDTLIKIQNVTSIKLNGDNIHIDVMLIENHSLHFKIVYENEKLYINTTKRMKDGKNLLS